MKKIQPVTIKDGKVVLGIDSIESNADWIRAARLMNEDTPESRKLLKEMDNTPIYEKEPDDA